MSRRPRLALPGIPLHITQRGNNRSDCFAVDSDYQVYLSLLVEYSGKFNCAVHAYVLMTNHVHLLVTPGEVNSGSRLMKQLGQCYTHYFNRRYGRTGTLWEGRFKSCVVQSYVYLLACHRYIELNPVRAGMVNQPQDYRWSSFRANALGQHDLLVTCHKEYLQLGRDDQSRQMNYRTLFDRHVDPRQLSEIRTASNGNFALGNPEFLRYVESSLMVRACPDRPGRRKRATLR